MGAYKALAIDEHNRQMAEIMAEYNTKTHIENALAELESFRQGPGTFENYEYIHLELCLALHKIERTA